SDTIQLLAEPAADRRGAAGSTPAAGTQKRPVSALGLPRLRRERSAGEAVGEPGYMQDLRRTAMRKLLLAGAALLAIGAVTPALADDAATAAGGTAGAATGATAGFFIAGPVGAVVGGVIGAGVGAGVSSSAQDYARAHRVASVEYDGTLRPGYRVG